MKQIAEFWNSLSLRSKVIAILILIIVAWIAWVYLGEKKDTIERIIKEKTEIQVLAENGIKPSYVDEVYKQYAGILYTAMNGPGTDITAIFAVIRKLKNDADFIATDSAFGVRLGTYETSWLTDPKDLRYWLRDDLSTEAMASLNKQLANQGITKRF